MRPSSSGRSGKPQPDSDPRSALHRVIRTPARGREPCSSCRRRPTADSPADPSSRVAARVAAARRRLRDDLQLAGLTGKRDTLRTPGQLAVGVHTHSWSHCTFADKASARQVPAHLPRRRKEPGDSRGARRQARCAAGSSRPAGRVQAAHPAPRSSEHFVQRRDEKRVRGLAIITRPEGTYDDDSTCRLHGFTRCLMPRGVARRSWRLRARRVPRWATARRPTCSCATRTATR
jgi:hypothetical protein